MMFNGAFWLKILSRNQSIKRHKPHIIIIILSNFPKEIFVVEMKLFVILVFVAMVAGEMDLQAVLELPSGKRCTGKVMRGMERCLTRGYKPITDEGKMCHSKLEEIADGVMKKKKCAVTEKKFIRYGCMDSVQDSHKFHCPTPTTPPPTTSPHETTRTDGTGGYTECHFSSGSQGYHTGGYYEE